MRLRAIVPLMVAAWLVSGPARAAAPADQTIAHQAQAALDAVAQPDGPGAVVLIARGDRVLFRAARGRSNIELAVPLAPDQTFRIASVTKMFTAALVVKLSEEGKLALDDPLAKYLPDFPNAANITLRQLLSHTSGVSDIVHDIQPGFTRRDVDTATLVAEIAKRPPDFAPGARQAYSNAGYILLGAVIEKVTGQPWPVALHDRLLQPLGLSHTELGAASPVIAGRVAGYTTDTPGHAVANASFISITIPGAAGGLASTADDLRLWMRALTSGRVVSAGDFALMTTPAAAPPAAGPAHPYGLGLYIWHVRGHAIVGHTGQIDGFTSAAVAIPDSDITIVVLANDDNFDARTMARRLAAIALGQPYSDAPAARPSDADLAALAGAYRIDDTAVWTLTVKDHQLLAQRGRRNPIPLSLATDGTLHFVPDEITYFAPIRDAAGHVVRLDQFDDGEGPPRPLPRVAAP